jgi:uncharacterized membrane protein YvbJ
MFCNKCGKEIPDNSSFCNFCGQKIELLNKEKKEEQSQKQTEDQTEDSIKGNQINETNKILSNKET